MLAFEVFLFRFTGASMEQGSSSLCPWCYSGNISVMGGFHYKEHWPRISSLRCVSLLLNGVSLQRKVLSIVLGLSLWWEAFYQMRVDFIFNFAGCCRRLLWATPKLRQCIWDGPMHLLCCSLLNVMLFGICWGGCTINLVVGHGYGCCCKTLLRFSSNIPKIYLTIIIQILHVNIQA